MPRRTWSTKTTFANQILTPGKKVREGFENKMPSFKGQISDKEIDAIIALIKSLK